MEDIEQLGLFSTPTNNEEKLNEDINVKSKKEIYEEISSQIDEELNESLVDDSEEDSEENNDYDDDSAVNDLVSIGRKIDFNRSERRIRDLKNDEADGLLEKQPYFQRKYVWTNKKASLLIESILLNVPIPMIYTAEDKETKTELVVDGQQRLTSAFRFLDGEFELTGLKSFKDLNGKKYKQLDRDYQLKIARYPLSVIKVSADSDEEVKFEIFERINSGAANLNDQELRNCIYRGYYTEFIKICAKNKVLHDLMFGGKISKRMEDSEMVLRFFAFYLNGYTSYLGILKKFLNDHSRDYRLKFNKENQAYRKKEFSKYKKVFLNSLSLSKTVFGEHAFCSCSFKGDVNTKKLAWAKPSKLLFDVIMTGFAQYDKSQIVPYSDSIRESLINIMLSDSKFIPKDGTLSATNVKHRFTKWYNELQSIVSCSKQPRSFSYKLKEELYKNNPTCTYCGQKIATIDDSEIDHDLPYWKGGATIPENAKLMHRFCNRTKSGK